MNGGPAQKPDCSSALLPPGATIGLHFLLLCIFPIVGEDVYKVREEPSEMWGAAEVQEDEDTRVEVPLDQVLIELEISGFFFFLRITGCVLFFFHQFLSSVQYNSVGLIVTAQGYGFFYGSFSKT